MQQASLTLPDSGGLVRPLSHGRFLVGLLVVEREAGAALPALDPAADGASHVLDPGAATPTGGEARCYGGVHLL